VKEDSSCREKTPRHGSCKTLDPENASVAVNSHQRVVQDAADRLEADARAAGAFGLGTDRHLEGVQPLLAPPPGAELATVHVRYAKSDSPSCLMSVPILRIEVMLSSCLLGALVCIDKWCM
jgi:hypothetical protein